MIVNGMCIARGKKIGQSTDIIAREHKHTQWGVYFGAKSNFTKLLRPVAKPYIHTCEY